MRKNVFGRQFKRDTNERKALFKSLSSSLVLHERIQTTEQKAKAIKGHVEKLVTKAKKGDLQAERLIQPYLHTSAVGKMMTDIAPRFKTRPGGYTRIIRMGTRLQDNSSMVILEWVEKRAVDAVSSKKTKKTTSKVEKSTPVKKTEKPKKGKSREARSGSAREAKK